MKTRLDRFYSKVHKTQSCWEWTGTLINGDYGQFWDGNKKIYAHRWSYEYFIGPIPNDMQLDHLCRNRCCVNPEHLEPVTARENTMRGNTITAHHAFKTHCERGHEYTIENTYNIKTGGRMCRECKRIKEREYYHAVRKVSK